MYSTDNMLLKCCYVIDGGGSIPVREDAQPHAYTSSLVFHECITVLDIVPIHRPSLISYPPLPTASFSSLAGHFVLMHWRVTLS